LQHRVRRISQNPRGGRAVLAAKWDGHTVFTVNDLAEIFQMSRWAAYEAVKHGEIDSFRMGRLIRIARHTIERKLGAEQQPAA
jgi:hypothetical protein